MFTFACVRPAKQLAEKLYPITTTAQSWKVCFLIPALLCFGKKPLTEGLKFGRSVAYNLYLDLTELRNE